MKILILPRNIGSEMNFRIKAYEKVGLEVRGLAFETSNMASHENIVYLPRIPNIYNPIRRLMNILKYRELLKEQLKWADIVHWVYDLNYIPLTNISIEYDILSKSKLPGVIQWCGSDIRNHEIEMNVNEYYKKAYLSKEWDYNEDSSNSIRNQRYFSKLKYVPLIFPTLGKYVNKNLFERFYFGHIMVGATDLIPKFPSINNLKPKIVHAPSKRGTKGTKYILHAINKLSKVYDFNFELIENIPHKIAIEKYANSDIFIDQLIGGGYGSASVEAMALGKPVICYINSLSKAEYPNDLPIVNANPDNILEVIENLIQKPEMRFNIGLASRKYVEKYHNDIENAIKMKDFYASLLI